MRTIIRNIKTIVNILEPGCTKLRFDESDVIEITTCGSGSNLAIIADNGNIVDFGEEESILRKSLEADCIVDCDGGCVLPGVYNLKQSARILEAGKALGLNMNFHADELSDIGGAELAGKIGARAVSHLEEASPAGVAAMAASGTAAVLLPTTAHLLRLRPPPARAILQAGVAVALGTDFNPNAYCMSMPIVMYFACTMMGLTPDEALVASTINAAYSLNMSHKIGAITVGRQADLVVLNCERWENIIYQLGEAEALITHVIKKGKLIYRKDSGFTSDL